MTEVGPVGWPDSGQMRQLRELYMQSIRLKKASIPGFGASYVVFLPTGWLDGDPEGARAFGMQVFYHPDIDAPVIGFDPASRGLDL